MSIPMLRELHQDVRRLVIAGSALAAADTRLLKALPGLRRLGESAPVFKRVADEVEAAAAAPAEDSAARLLELSSLLLAILHTQGSSDAPGELRSIGLPLDAVKPSGGPISYRRLHPVIEALTSRGSGRLEVIRQGFEEGMFADFRTFVPAVEALGDVYSEIADFAAETIIPAIGDPALPILRNRYSVSGGSADAKRLMCICKLSGDKDEVIGLIAKAIESGTAPVKLSAIAQAAGLTEFEATLLGLAGERKSDVREAALLALSAFDSDAAANRIVEALLGEDAHIAIIPAQRCRHAGLIDELLLAGKETSSAIASGDKEPRTYGKLMAIVEALRARIALPEVVEFYKGLLLEPHYKPKGYKYMLEMIGEAFRGSQNRELLLFLHELRDTKEVTFGYSFESALICLPPEEVYDRYEIYLSDKKNTRGKLLIGTLSRYGPDPLAGWRRGTEVSVRAWDVRWAQRLAAAGELELACRFANEPSDAMAAFLLEQYKDKPHLLESRTLYIIDALKRLGHQGWDELLLSALEQSSSRAYYIAVDVQGLIRELPAASVPRLRAWGQTFKSVATRQQLEELIYDLENQSDAKRREA